jgi:hypothetical protein
MGWSGKLGAALVVGATKGSAGRSPLGEVADELAEAEDEVVDAAMLSTVSNPSAKDSAEGCARDAPSVGERRGRPRITG